jgi:hypothetical protein
LLFNNIPNKLFRLGLILFVVALRSPVSRAQAKVIWQAAVVPSGLRLYAQPSSVSRVAAVLKEGDVVNVNFELNLSGDKWCRIELSSQIDTGGYVLCKDLERRDSQVSTQVYATKKAIARGVVLVDQDILDMNKAGLSSNVLIAKIKSSTCEFDTSSSRLQQLKEAGVPDSVILAMVEVPDQGSKTIGAAKSAVESPKPATPRNDPPAAVNIASSPVTPGSSAVNVAIPPGSTVFIEPMKGFETYLIAALQKKKVPLVVVSNEENAKFVITGDSDTKKAGWAKIVFMGNLHSDEEASVAMVDNKTGTVVFAYAVNKKNTLHGQQTSAEACAKHLKGRIEGKE